tara:strand:+ start:241 stop:705 length:465 start_codon:yes stop_codon:yes gene_type:complete
MRLLLTLLLILLLSSCGFKVLNQAENVDFSIAEITTTGDKRIGFQIKNKLVLKKNGDLKKKINLSIETNKNKIIKEKNIKNEITKYQIIINVKVSILEIDNLNKLEFTKSESGVYDVDSQFSKTIDNEKKLVKLLSASIAEDILDEIILKINDI